MSDRDFSITFSVEQTPERVYDAIKDVRAWWGAGIEGSAGAVGDVFRYRHEDIHDTTQKLVEAVPSEKLVWKVTDANLTFVDTKDEWKGTEIRFDLGKRGGKTEVRFTHVGLSKASECFEMCSKGWSYYVGESLKSLLTTGQGKPDSKEKGRPRA